MPVYDTKVEAPFYTGASTQFFLINLFQYVEMLSKQPEQTFLAFVLLMGSKHLKIIEEGSRLSYVS